MFPMNFPMQTSSFTNGGRNNIAILAPGTTSSEVKELSFSRSQTHPQPWMGLKDVMVS